MFIELTVRLPGSQYIIADIVTRLRFPAIERDLSLLQNFQTGSVAHLASYSMDIGSISLGVEWSGCEADHSLHLVKRLRMSRAICPFPPYAFMVYTQMLFLMSA
jgi:hypothetical protein